jgi:hypothetical protein
MPLNKVFFFLHSGRRQADSENEVTRKIFETKRAVEFQLTYSF